MPICQMRLMAGLSVGKVVGRWDCAGVLTARAVATAVRAAERRRVEEMGGDSGSWWERGSRPMLPATGERERWGLKTRVPVWRPRWGRKATALGRQPYDESALLA